MRKLVSIVFILAGFSFLSADTTDVILGYAMVGNTIPFWGSGYGAHRFQTVFLQNNINTAGRIIKIAFQPEDNQTATYNNLRMYFCHTNRSNNVSAIFDDNYDGNMPELMFDSSSCTFYTISGQWLEIPVNFNYNNTSNLLWEVRWRGSGSQNMFIYVHYVSGSDTYRVFSLGSDSAATGSADYVRYHVKLTIETTTGIKEVIIGEKPESSRMLIMPSLIKPGEKARIELVDREPADNTCMINIYDPSGRLVRSLCIDESDGVNWDLKDDRGGMIQAGVYFIQAGSLGGRIMVIE